jgi:hypothetical protein
MIRQIRYPLTIFIILILGFVAFERMFSPFFQTCINEHQENKDTALTKENPSSFYVAAATYIRCSGGFVNANGNGITALATVVIAAFTVTLWIATSKQGEFTRTTLVLDKRALISADTFHQFYEADAATNTYNWRLRPRWRNTGGTSSRNLTTHVECEIRNTMLPSGYSFSYRDDDIGTGIIPPKAELMGGVAPQGGAITAQDISDSQLGKKFIYLWGIAKYYDVFPDTPERIFHFCWLIVAVGDPFTFKPNTVGEPPTLGAMTFSLIQHKEGNYET